MTSNNNLAFVGISLLIFLSTVMCTRPLFEVETEAGIIGRWVESGGTCTRLNEPCGRIQFLSEGRLIVQDFPFHLFPPEGQTRGDGEGSWYLDTTAASPGNPFMVFYVRNAKEEAMQSLDTKVGIAEPRKVLLFVYPGGHIIYFEKVDEE